MYILILSLILIYIISIIYFIKNNKKIIEKIIQKKEKIIEAEIEEKQSYSYGLDFIIQEKTHMLDNIQDQISLLEHLKEETQKKLATFESTERQKLEEQFTELRKQKTENLELQLAKEMNERRTQAEHEHSAYLTNIKNQQETAEVELAKIKTEVDNFQAKQETINQEILRRRELEERSDFYRVCLSEEAIADISLLQEVRKNLKKPEFLDKLIYDNYVAKAVLEMIKRVLQNSTCSGIYKITCQKTKEVYIGKSTDIKNRWQQHCKTAFNCGTIASSLLHRKMQQYGIENFTFELLEVVPKDQLSEREKFYINFYKTKEVGLNERNG